MKHARGIAVAVGAAALVLGAAGPAAAHVTVTASSTTGGGSAVLTFKVPVESATAHTVELTVHLPSSTPLTSVLSEPVPGWRVQLARTGLATPAKDDDGGTVTSAVTAVTWTATEGGLAPGQFGRFSLSVGPLPASGTLYLPTVQRYSDGTEVDWVQQAQDGAEPEHPAPSVTITRAAASSPVAASPGGSGGSGGSQGGWGVGLGVAGIVLALGAGAAGGTALSRGRRPAVALPAAATSSQDAERTPS
ncbi:MULTISPECIES: YcnI family protein [unclassified Streptomyces]|uniref:YcnI family protein n=1 Tax=unclassified Streptomyces TaxID=2593676 RepID=UPI002E2BC169|nr:YcnI family protein [Streptomyces sp. NBC_00223]